MRRVFIGLENINPDNLIAAKKRQNKITDYREMLQKWRDHGAITCAGYIIGFPGDTKELIAARHRDHQARAAARHPRVLLPDAAAGLGGPPGAARQTGVWMDPDLNKYDLNHRVTHHPKMSDAEWEEAYRAAWEAFYTPEHMRTILRRAAANKLGRPSTTLSTILWFKLVIAFEGVHPLEGGAFRLKFRRDRRAGMPLESPLVFYPRYLRRDRPSSCGGYWSVYRESKTILDEVMAAPDRWTYTDRRSRRRRTTSSRRSTSTTRPPAATPRSRASVAATLYAKALSQPPDGRADEWSAFAGCSMQTSGGTALGSESGGDAAAGIEAGLSGKADAGRRCEGSE